MNEEKIFQYEYIDVSYRLHPNNDGATARFRSHDGVERSVELVPQQGGGAHVAFVPPEMLEAITALGFHLWPRPA